MLRASVAALLLVGAPAVHAADFDTVFGDGAVERRAAAPLPVEPRVIVNSPLAIGGPYILAPGLNGPLGPPAYPLLPFAFGYGY